MIRVGVILSGCGVNDGAEIHEAVLTMLALDEKEAKIICMAPDIEQYHVINHMNGEVQKEKRNVLVEASRIARGEISDIAAVKSSDLDALILPGGFGAAKNLSSFAFDGANCSVNAAVNALVREMHKEGKPVGAACIAPVVIAKIFENRPLRLTIGTDPEVAGAVRSLGHEHCDCRVDEICIDEDNKIVTTPAYMLGENVAQVYSGIQKLVNRVVQLAEQNVKA